MAGISAVIVLIYKWIWWWWWCYCWWSCWRYCWWCDGYVWLLLLCCCEFAIVVADTTSILQPAMMQNSFSCWNFSWKSCSMALLQIKRCICFNNSKLTTAQQQPYISITSSTISPTTPPTITPSPSPYPFINQYNNGWYPSHKCIDMHENIVVRPIQTIFYVIIIQPHLTITSHNNNLSSFFSSSHINTTANINAMVLTLVPWSISTSWYRHNGLDRYHGLDHHHGPHQYHGLDRYHRLYLCHGQHGYLGLNQNQIMASMDIANIDMANIDMTNNHIAQGERWQYCQRCRFMTYCGLLLSFGIFTKYSQIG